MGKNRRITNFDHFEAQLQCGRAILQSSDSHWQNGEQALKWTI